MSTVSEKVLEIITEQLFTEEPLVTPEHHLRNDLDFDSLDIIEFVMKLEKAFDINIPDEHIADNKTIGDWIAYVEKKHLGRVPKTI